MIEESNSIGDIALLRSLATEAEQLFAERRYAECLERLDAISSAGATASGLHLLAAMCCINLKRYERVLSELEKEKAQEVPSPDVARIEEAFRVERAANPALVEDLAPNSHYLVSGVPVGVGGSGLFLAELMPHAQQASYRVITPHQKIGLSDAEQIIISSIRDSEVFIFHPQSLGLACMRALYEAGNKLSMYVLDNSFFCIQSYNHRKQKRGECLDCIGAVSRCAPECTPFPTAFSRQENLEFLEWLQSVATNIRFFCQSYHHAALLAAHFGSGVWCKVVGMKTPEFEERPQDSLKSDSLTPRFHVVYHGHAVEAKGLRYALELARELPELSFLIPGSVDGIRAELSGLEIPRNCVVGNISWHTGLKDAVLLCDLVLCPSEWSATVEGALLKSLHYNGSVAVLETRYGFEREIPDDVVLKLPLDAQQGAQRVRQQLSNKEERSSKGRAWVERYLQSTRIHEIFLTD